MIVLKTYHIEGSDDKELDIKRASKLTYHIAYDDQKEPDGVIFSVPGFGEDSDINYQLNLIQHIAKTYNLLVVCVEYHCFFSRIRNGATYGLNPFDTEFFLDIIQRYKIELDPNNLDFKSIVEKLNQYIENEKLKDPSQSEYRENIFATIIPEKDEYQNFGVLQSIDILTVLYHIKSLGFQKLLSKKPIFAFGSSHGAYIINLVMKIAPNTFDAIIENSAYVKPPLKYIVGQEYDIRSAETYYYYKNSILIHSFTLTKWTLNQASPNFFGDNPFEIRDLSNKNQLEQFSKYESKTELISYHGVEDIIAPFEEKESYIDYLNKHTKQKISFTIVKDKHQIDGKLIKDLKHAMGMSNKELLNHHLPKLLNKYKTSSPTDLCKKSTIIYKTSSSQSINYTFKYLDDKISFSLD